jgi:hypothetical protein
MPLTSESRDYLQWDMSRANAVEEDKLNNHCWHVMWQPKSVIFFRCQYLCVLLIYITCRIFCAKGITVSQIFCYYVLKCWSWKTWKKMIFDIFEVWIKELFWNTINCNDIMCNFKALLNIFLHFGMDEMYQRGIFTKPIFFSPLFLRILAGDFGRVFP